MFVDTGLVQYRVNTNAGEQEVQKLELAAHLVTSRGLYTHHGIYVGNNEVIHYSGLSDGLNAGPIEVTSLLNFTGGRDLRIRSYRNPKFSGVEAAVRARLRLGEDDYDLHANNCEHFCTWVIMGEHESAQVEFVENFLNAVIGGDVLGEASRFRRDIKQASGTKEVVTAIAKSSVSGLAKGALINSGLAVGAPSVLIYKGLRKLFK